MVYYFWNINFFSFEYIDFNFKVVVHEPKILKLNYNYIRDNQIDKQS